MLNLSRIQLELERAKEKLRNVEETIQKVEGKTFSNGPIRYGGIKNEYHSDKTRNPASLEDMKNPRRRIIASAIDSRIQRLPADDSPFGLKRGIREKRESGLGLKRQGGDSRPQGVFARLSGAPYHQADEEDDDDFGKKPTLPSRVYTTATEVPSRQEVIAAQAQDEQSKERNKRMFGALVGTLQKFRKEETRVREREEKRMKVEKKLEEDAKREKEKLMQEKRELFMEKKRREVEIKRIEWSLNRVKEYEAWEADVLPLKNFIQTQAKPHIFYLPNVHNAKTEERLVHSQKLVERMIEKRKTNLKEEIENSEKKARKAAAEEAEEEEAENIPEDNEESVTTEQQMQIEFETKKENGYFEEGKKDQAESPKIRDGDKETCEEEEKWDKIEKPDTKQPDEDTENVKESCGDVKEENNEEIPLANSKESNDDENTTVSNEKLTDRIDGDTSGETGDQNDDKLREAEQCEKVEQESNDLKTEERADDTSEANGNVEELSKEAESTEKVTKNVAEQETTGGDFAKSDDNVEPNGEDTAGRKLVLSESEPKNADVCKKKLESHDDKSKTAREKSQSRKSNKCSKSPKRSRSPKNSRSKRQRSSSRQRRVSRRQSSSNSPPRKSRRSKSPPPRRGQRNFSLRKRSPLLKSRRRRSSSRSSSSVSPRKKRSRSSSSSSSSKSD